MKHAGMTGYPCCAQPTGEPIHNGYIHPIYKVARHICWTIFWDCDACGEVYVTDWDEKPDPCDCGCSPSS